MININGVLDEAEFGVMMRKLAADTRRRDGVRREYTPGQLKALYRRTDIDGDGNIDFNEFLNMMTARMGDRDSREEIIKVFRLFDDDETQKISFKNLKRVAQELGENMTDEELQEMIDEADRDGDGEVNEEEFFRIMKRRGFP